MRRAEVYQTAALAGYLTETEAKEFRFEYVADYKGRPVSLTMPVRTEPYEFDKFPPFFEGLLPEGRQLEALLRTEKLDRNDNAISGPGPHRRSIPRYGPIERREPNLFHQAI
jgi:serine/threonine-protein kinase HipA